MPREVFELLIPFEVMSLFVLAAAGLAVAPGPDNIFVLTQAALYGRRAGWWVTLGLCTGLLAHTAAVAVGLAALMAASATAFTVVKVLGALYLIYLAWGAFKAQSVALQSQDGPVLSARQLYLRGVIMNITNPKVAIFFLAFLPQFTSASYGPMSAQLLLLGALFMLVTLLVFGAIALMAAQLGHHLRRKPSWQQLIHRTAGVIFLGLAARLLISGRG